MYKLSKDAVLETFEDGGLALILPERRLEQAGRVLIYPERRVVELNSSAAEIVSLLDGHRTVEQVLKEITNYYDISREISVTKIYGDVLQLCMELNQNGLLEFIPDLEESMDMTTAIATYFQRNPDVVLREEDPDEGALLFNPDTNQVKVINTTGLYIFQQFGEARTLDEVVDAVQKGFDEIPLEQIAQDVQEFIEGMVANGFIGTVEKAG